MSKLRSHFHLLDLVILLCNQSRSSHACHVTSFSANPGPSATRNIHYTNPYRMFIFIYRTRHLLLSSSISMSMWSVETDQQQDKKTKQKISSTRPNISLVGKYHVTRRIDTPLDIVYCHTSSVIGAGDFVRTSFLEMQGLLLCACFNNFVFVSFTVSTI